MSMQVWMWACMRLQLRQDPWHAFRLPGTILCLLSVLLPIYTPANISHMTASYGASEEFPSSQQGPETDEDRIPALTECGPACACPASCRNRVCQQGLKHRVELYKDKRWALPTPSLLSRYSAEVLLIPEIPS